jgi:CysZ protein
MREQRRAHPGFFSGLTYPLRGAKLVFRTHPRLARYWVFPVLLTFGSLLVVMVAAVRHRTDFVHAIWASADPASQPVGWWLGALSSALGWLLAAGAVALGGLIILSVSGVVAAPFNDALSAAVEGIYGGAPPETSPIASILAGAARSVATEVIKLLAYGLLVGPLWVVALFAPLVGGPILAAAGFAITVAYLAVDYTDWPASRRDTPLRKRGLWLRRHAAPLAGFGVTAWFLLWVPGINLVLMPAAVAGGTLLYLDLETAGATEAPLLRPVGRKFAG